MPCADSLTPFAAIGDPDAEPAPRRSIESFTSQHDEQYQHSQAEATRSEAILAAKLEGRKLHGPVHFLFASALTCMTELVVSRPRHRRCEWLRQTAQHSSRRGAEGPRVGAQDALHGARPARHCCSVADRVFTVRTYTRSFLWLPYLRLDRHQAQL